MSLQGPTYNKLIIPHNKIVPPLTYNKVVWQSTPEYTKNDDN